MIFQQSEGLFRSGWAFFNNKKTSQLIYSYEAFQINKILIREYLQESNNM